ncbi:MAG: T9SS type A sorting domain-containing protein [Ulvibacter sp.]|nr:T9SS type A sorting domain-containing protein [Ulvibacter sp.]
MKKILLTAFAIATTLCTIAQQTIDVSMGAGYTSEVYYKLDTQTAITFQADSWDVAFLRNDDFNLSVRVNDGIDIKVFEVADTPEQYGSVDVSNQNNWVELVNGNTNWEDGAFMQGSATFGFGEYNPATNHVEGTIIYVLQYDDGSYRKMIIEDYFGAYTFKYATWDGSTWSSDTTATVANTSNPDNRYNYYSLQNNQEVVAEPSEDNWDFVFRKYTSFINPPGQNYVVSGALHNPNVTVAQNQETSDADPNGLDYLEEINTIGYDWKSFTGTWNIDSDQKYYVKYDNNTVYRMYFTDFGGSASGDLSFVLQDVTDLLSFESVSENLSFGMYPNPSLDGTVTIVYENKNTAAATNTIRVYAVNGAQVYKTTTLNNNGFFNKQLDLSFLDSGMYILQFDSGDTTISKKLILN